MQGILGRSGRDLMEVAARLGFDGVEPDVRGLDDPLLQAGGARALRQAADDAGLAIPSLCLGALNGMGLGSADPGTTARAEALVRAAVPAARELGASVILLPFFGAAELRDPQDRSRAAAALAALAPAAQAAGVVLAVENTLSADDNLALLATAGSPAVGVYFDVSNAMWWGHDSPSEIRRLGPAMVAVHFKDGSGGHSNAMLGQGHVDFPAVADALRAVGYDGWIVLESAAPNDRLADAATTWPSLGPAWPGAHEACQRARQLRLRVLRAPRGPWAGRRRPPAAYSSKTRRLKQSP